MKTNIAKNIGIMLCMIIVSTLTSCSFQPNQSYGHGGIPSAVPVGMARQMPSGPMTPQQRRLEGAKGFITMKGHKSLSPIEATPEAYRSIISNKRFIRDADGIISRSVFRTIASGGVIGWSGHDYGFEPQVQEVTGVTDRVSVTEVARACIKFQQFSPATSGPGRIVRARALELERQRGYTLH